MSSSWSISADSVIGVTRMDWDNSQTLQVRFYNAQGGGVLRTLELREDEVLDVRISANGAITIMGLYPAARLGRGRVREPGEDS